MMSRVPFMGDKADYYVDATMPRRARYIPVVLAAASEGQTSLQASRITVAELTRDECVRSSKTAESLAAMEPGFAALAQHYADALDGPIDHRHTIAHALPVCDGAANGREAQFLDTLSTSEADRFVQRELA
jgi:acetyl-CoA C-acetyltransferase/acetyl-CoA acyltransferase